MGLVDLQAFQPRYTGGGWIVLGPNAPPSAEARQEVLGAFLRDHRPSSVHPGVAWVAVSSGRGEEPPEGPQEQVSLLTSLRSCWREAGRLTHGAGPT